MIRLIRKNSICAATDTHGVDMEYTVSIDAIASILCQIVQIQDCEIKLDMLPNHNIRVYIDDMEYDSE